jgi:DNA modification methylase
MKPVELVERALRNSSRPGDGVLDAFGGSGTTLIAAEKTGRRARLMELDPKYSDVIIRRWQDWSGQGAVRERDGVAFDDVTPLAKAPGSGATMALREKQQESAA